MATDHATAVEPDAPETEYAGYVSPVVDFVTVFLLASVALLAVAVVMVP